MKRGVIWFKSFKSLKNDKCQSCHFLKRSNQKTTILARGGQLKNMKKKGVFCYSSARPPKARGHGQLPGLPSGSSGPG